MKRLSQKDVEKKFLKRGLFLLSEYKNSRTKVKVRCICNNIFYVTARSIFYGTQISCGCENRRLASIRRKKDLTNKRFNKLLAIKTMSNKDNAGNYYWKCLCDCGKTCFVTSNHMLSGNTKSCGKCCFRHNGIATSSCVFTINKWLPNAKHNFNIQNMNVDLCLIEDKLVIEYDEWYWHKNSTQKDNKKTERLIKLGWSVLRIRARRNMPRKDQVLKIAKEISNKNQYKELILDGWGED